MFVELQTDTVDEFIVVHHPIYLYCYITCQVLDEVDRILEEVKHDWLSCLERAVYDKRGWPQPLTAAR